MKLALISARPHLADKAKNLSIMENAIKKTKADIYIFGEFFLQGDRCRDEIRDLAERVDGPSLAHMKQVAKRLNVAPVAIQTTDLEKKAAQIVPRQTGKAKQAGYGGIAAIVRQVPPEQSQKYPSKNAGDTTELGRLCNGKHSALDIQKMLDAQSPRRCDLQSVINYLEVLKLAGLVEF